MARTDWAASCGLEGAVGGGITVGYLPDVHVHVERKADKKACGLMFSKRLYLSYLQRHAVNAKLADSLPSPSLVTAEHFP
jgi:hypothetical protein